MKIIPGIPASAQGLKLRELCANARIILHVSANDRAMNALAGSLPFFVPNAEILRFPAWDTLPYDRVSPRSSIMAERVQVLSKLATPRSSSAAVAHQIIILTTANAIIQRVPPREVLQKALLKLRVGESTPRAHLLEFLQTNGYRRTGKAIEAGEYALRGSITDIITPTSSSGLRLDFFGDELESIKAFDPMTQLSSGDSLTEITLTMAGELVMNDASRARFRTRYREAFGAVSREDALYEALSNGYHHAGAEHFLPLFYERLDTLMDYAEGAQIVLDAEAEKAIHERQESILDYFRARAEAKPSKDAAPYHPLPPEQHYLLEAHWEVHARERDIAVFSALSGEKTPWRLAPNLVAGRAGATITPAEQLMEMAAQRRTQGRSLLLAALSNGSADRLTQMLSERGTHVVRVDTFDDIKRISGKSIGVCVLPLAQGFETETLTLITEQDLLGERIIRAKPRKKSVENFLAEAANFNEGELVVHREHGIGRFAGLITLEVQGARHDCLKLVYDGDDKLFIPVENIDLITRYGEDDDSAKLDKLGAASWQNRKARMKERIKIAAEALLKTAAERQLKTAPELEAQAESYDAFCAKFGYVETEDQLRSIEDTLEDLRSGRPMDRLICGDVGFGKTEVALRAAFAAVSAPRSSSEAVAHETPRSSSEAVAHETPRSSSEAVAHNNQVALIVPTTLLSRQHYKNFAERFRDTPYKVAQLSRMVPAAEQKKVREQLTSGDVDIVIGTHALLAKNIQFKNLALVIVDEEQHFGVGQKERLKELKADVHVLTLSATPIPRTLHMALSGVRSLSLITTPPVDRLAVRSFTMPWDGVVLREAILREQHRGGRTFFVCPRIKDIAEVKQKLAELVPEVKLAVAHGQMTPTELDDIMNAFQDGAYDVLLSTAIVESGLDIPAANTMIIYRADRFGLGQLYQLRGRVGRGKIRAYAYFLLPTGKELTSNATRRLEVMQSLDTLGAGFQLASHDMDIRGFGNLVGEEQSGHIKEIGIELYQQMLEEAVSSLRLAVGSQKELQTANCQLKAEFSPQINLGMSVLIPETYVEDLSLRMGLYRRASSLNSPEEIDAFGAEMIDRFGTMPEEVSHFIEILRIKMMCKQAGISRMDAGPKGAVITFWQDAFAKPEALLVYISKHPTTLKLRPDQKLIFMREWSDSEKRMKDIAKLAGEVAGL